MGFWAKFPDVFCIHDAVKSKQQVSLWTVTVDALSNADQPHASELHPLEDIERVPASGQTGTVIH